jgi:predicted nucleic acid-binding protein
MAHHLGHAQQQGGLVIAAPVYAELRAHPKAKPGFVDNFLDKVNIRVDFALEESVWREAARAFSEYANRRRKSEGVHPKRLLVDFIVGAHALVCADRLLTLDSSRYKQSFPKLRLFPLESD